MKSQVLYRRVYGTISWGTPIATLAYNATSYSDTNVTPGVEYEYELQQDFNSAVTFSSNKAATTIPAQALSSGNLRAFGYICAGINLPYNDNRGTLLLLVDNTMTTPLATELAQLQQDLAGDGWKVVRTDLPRQTVDPSVTGTTVGPARLAELQSVKNVIKTAYTADPTHVKAVYILGHLPVPYSGNNNPDSHSEHLGAWPADTYYADMTGTWSDTTINSSSAYDARNRNIPGDGKFDQSALPNSTLTLAVGRVDLVKMTQAPNASVTEAQLLQRYLRKAHQYRFRQGAYAAIQRRAVAQEWWGEGAPESLELGTNAILGRNLVGISNVDYLGYSGGQNLGATWQSWMNNHPGNNYLFGYGQGGGGYSSAQGVGTSLDFGTQPSRAVFTSMFGSYMGDWDVANNFLKAPLAGNATGDSLGLCCFWSGRPLWLIHPMAMGSTLGEITRLSQSYIPSSYPLLWSYFEGYSHTGLMGDPALRLYSVQPPQNVVAQSKAGGVTLSWDASTDTNIIGYQVYRSTSATGPFTTLTPTALATTTFTDGTATAGTAYTYLVKTLKLETPNGGSFQNPSAGSPVTITANNGATSVPSSPNGVQAVTATSTQINLTWSASAGNPTGYIVQRASASGTFTTIATLGNVTSYTDAGPITAGTTFYYQIIATNAQGNSAPSARAYADGNVGFIQTPGASTRYATVTTGSGNSIDITVQRQGGNLGAIGVNYATSNGSAIAGINYTANSGTLTWADGDASARTIHILLAPSPQEPTTFYVTLSSPTGGATVLDPAICTVLIEDPNIPLQLPWKPIFYTANGVADPGYVSQLSNGEIADSLICVHASSFSVGRFIYQQVSGDTTLTMHVEAMNPLNPSATKPAQVGMMVHGTNMYYSPMVGLSMFGNNTGIKLLANNVQGSGPADVTPAGTQNTLSGAYWMRLSRAGNTFVGQISPDGLTWTLLGSYTLTTVPATPLYWGIWHQTSQYPTGLELARFNNISFTYPVPNAPTGLTAIGQTGSVTLTWSPSLIASGYNVLRRPEGTSTFTQLNTVALTGTTFTDSAVSADTGYEYQVTALNGNGASPGSNLAYAATPGANASLPIRASSLKGSVPSTGHISLQWSDNSSNETGFTVQVSTNAGTSYQTLATLAAGTTTYAAANPVVPVVTGNQLYRIVAFNASGSASPSLPVTLVPFAPASFANWATGYFGTDTVSAAYTATPKIDGVPNVVKYFSDINPTQAMSAADRAALPTVAVSGLVNGVQYLTLTYRQSVVTTGLNAELQKSTDAQNWVTIGNPTILSTTTDPATGDPVKTAGIPLNGAQLYLRLKLTLTSNPTSVTTTGYGYKTLSLPATGLQSVTSYVALPLTNPPVYASGVATVSGSSSLTVAGAPWTSGEFAVAGQPCFVKIVSGQQAGRFLRITANTANALTVDITDQSSQSTALNAANFAVLPNDGFQIIRGETLSSLLGDGSVGNPLALKGGTSAFVAETVSIYQPALSRSLSYYFNTTTKVWTCSTVAGSQNGLPLSPETVLGLTRSAGDPVLNLVNEGSLPDVAPLTKTIGNNTAIFASSRSPVDKKLSTLQIAGWVKSASVTTADTVSVWDQATARFYIYYQLPDTTVAGQWRRSGDATTDYSAFALPAGTGFQITKHAALSGAASYLFSPLVP